MGLNNMKRTVSNLNYAANDAASVHSARVEIFKLKKEMIRTPLLKEIVNSVFGDSGYIPRRIILNSSGIIARAYVLTQEPITPTELPYISLMFHLTMS